MNYSVLKTAQRNLEKDVMAASNALNKFPSGDFGLTPDSVKFTPEFKAAKKAYNDAFQTYRKMNQYINKNFKKEEAAARKAKMAERKAV